MIKKFRLYPVKSFFKQHLKTFAVWLLEKVDEESLKSMNVDLVTTVNIRKYLVKPGKWYHVAFSVEAWINRAKYTRTMKTKTTMKIFMDGVLKEELTNTKKND